MWFRMSYSLLYSNLFADITAARGKGDRPECRLSLIIQMLCASAEGATFESPAHISRRFSVGINNSQIVWDLCVKHHALEQTADGSFTMYNWMADCGIVGKIDKKKCVAARDSKQHSEYSQSEHVSEKMLERLQKVTKNGG